MSDTMCPLPWLHLFVDGMGHFYNCCLGTSTPEFSKDSDGKIIKAGEPNSIKRHWNSEFMQNLRQSMHDNKKHSSCDGCWRVEKTGSRSFRIDSKNEFKIDQSLQEKISLDPVIKYLDMRFGNQCNLACRMCTPYNSKKLFTEWEEIFGPEVTKNYKNMNWYESELFWDELMEFKDHFERIHLAGGEPLLIKQCWNFLAKMSNYECSKKIRISYNTNLSRIPEDAKKIWPKFGGILLLVSMDGVGKVNEFIRHPQKWDDIFANLIEIENNFEKYNIHVCQIQPTIQAYNIHRITEICDFLAQFKNIKRIPHINFLFTPTYFSAAVLPQSYRQEAVDKLEIYIRKVEDGWNNYNPTDKAELINSLRGVISYIQEADRSNLLQEFIRQNDVFDKHRNQKIIDYIPELEILYR